MSDNINRRNNEFYLSTLCGAFYPQARTQWEDGINEELHAIVNESKRTFSLLRDDPSPYLQHSDVVVAVAAPHDAVKFLFDSEDMLETGIFEMNLNKL